MDSSILGNLARDYFSGDGSKRKSVHTFIECLGLGGVVPFLCWHQLEELIKHKNYDVARNRVSFIKKLPNAAWIASSANGETLGSVVDLLRAECETILAHPDYTVRQVRDATRRVILRFGSGAEALEAYDDIWPVIRPQLWEAEDRARETVAISRADVVDISEEKLSSYLAGSIRGQQDTKAILDALRGIMASEIKSRGDSRITDPTAVARKFYSEIEEVGAEYLAAAGAGPEDALNHFGVSINDFGPEARMKDVMAMSEFRSKLKVVHKYFSLSWEQFQRSVAQHQVPSWTVQNSLFLHGQRRSEHKGSELNDRYLASFSPYCELTYVDSQVKEDFRRALSKSARLAEVMNAIEKVTTIERIQEKVRRGDF